MSAWDVYESRIAAHGGTKRGASYIREVRYINQKLPDNLSYQTVLFYPCAYSYNIDTDDVKEHSFSQNIAVINSDNLNEKYVYSLPEEDIQLGSIFYWMDNYWLVSERDANTTIYTKSIALQCNHLLKWITPDNLIISQWCVVEDGTKYLTGEVEDRDYFTTRGDSRISIQVSKNEFTDAFDREYRFLVDDDDSPHKLSYQLTKPLKKGYTYNGEGSFKFVLQEVTATQYDNHELGIADYYIHFPKDDDETDSDATGSDNGTEDTAETKKVWI